MLDTAFPTMVPSFAPVRVTGSDDPIDYDKIEKLFTGKHTSAMWERHAAVLNKIASIFKLGFEANDLKRISRVIELALDKISQGHNELIPALESLLRIAFLPLKNCDEESQGDYISAFVESLAKTLLASDAKLAGVAAEAIYIIVGGRSPSEILNPIKRLDPRQLKMQQARKSKAIVKNKGDASISNILFLIERSFLVEILINALERTGDDKIKQSILKILLKLTYFPISLSKLSQENGLSQLLHILSDTGNQQIFEIICEILWNVLRGGSKKGAAIAINKMGVSASSVVEGEVPLKALLLKVCDKSSPFKSNRNDYLFILNSIVEIAPDGALPSFQSSQMSGLFCHLLMSHALSGFIEIMKLANNDVPASTKMDAFLFTNSAEDYEFINTLMHTSMILCENEICLVEFLEEGLLEFLLTYIDPSQKNEKIRFWTQSQMQGLQLRALQFLNTIIPRIPQRWASINGNAILLEYLSLILKPEVEDLNTGVPKVVVTEPQEATVAAKPTGLVKSPVIGLVASTLRLFSRVSELGPSQKRGLGGLGAFKILMDILKDSSQNTETWRTAFLICSSLCQGCKSNKQLFGETGGVETLLPYLSFTSADPTEADSIILAAVECVWGSVCGSAANESVFFANDGIFALMDLIPKSPYLTQRHIMGCLLDLLENPKARSHVLEWRSSGNEQEGVANLLVHLWNKEEARLGVPKGNKGVLVNEKKPLAGSYQAKPAQPSKDGYVVEEISENLRAKIYAMFCKLGFEDFEAMLSPEEQIKLTLIAKYLDFKIGEVWEEISEELDQEGIRPVSPDLDCINTAKDVIVEKARRIQQRQAEILERAVEEERRDEGLFYQAYMKERNIRPEC